MKEPLQFAAIEIEASASSADSGFIVKVNGISSDIAVIGPSPGTTPTKRPAHVARNMTSSWFQPSAAHRPMARLSSMLLRALG